VLDRYREQDQVLLTKKSKKGLADINLKEWVKNIQFLEPNMLRLVVRYGDTGPYLKPEEIIKAVFHLDTLTIADLHIRKVGQILR